MTVVPCPNGCGGSVNTATDNYCTTCRRSLDTTEVIIPESYRTDETYAELRKESWCWEWWGPPDHRMRCRQPKGHPEGQHWDHERLPETPTRIISTDGELVAERKP